jgi:hypothetical protein
MSGSNGGCSTHVIWYLGAASAVMTVALSQEPHSAAALNLTYSLQVTSKLMPTSDPTCPLKLLTEGVGLTNLLGPVPPDTGWSTVKSASRKGPANTQAS